MIIEQNFGNNNVENDNYIFVKLKEFLDERYYNKPHLLKKLERRKGLKIKGILSNKNPDYLFFYQTYFQ